MNDPVAALNAALAGRYRIERELDAGGMATVFLADDLRHERKVALKVVHPTSARAVGAERFLAEIKTTAKLHHPHILPLFDSGAVDDLLFYVMPYVEGESLRRRLDRGPLPIDEAVSLAVDVADALDYAHRHGIVHRDIKPGNILIHDGRALVADFGIALALEASVTTRMTEVGTTLGTVHYMSPEQATGDGPVAPASDLYSLGCVLYEMLAGERAHEAGSRSAILAKIVSGSTPPVTEKRPEVPAHVEAAIRRAMAVDPSERFASGADFAEALRSGRGAVGAPPRRKRWPSVAAAGALAAALVAVLAWSVWPSAEPMAPAVQRSVAVLPFQDMSEAGDQDFFVEGLAEEIQIALTRIGDLKVSARSSALAFRESTADLRTIADSLGVAHILTGSVRKAGDRVRVSSVLSEAATRSEVWARSFEGSLTDIFAIQDSIATAIARELDVTLAIRDGGRLVEDATENPEAHETYLRGRYFWNRRTGESLLAAIREFEEAVLLDSEYAEAWAALADTYLLAAGYQLSSEPGLAFRRAYEAAQRALALDADLSLARVALGYYYGTLGRWEEAEAELRRAVELTPGDAYPYYRLGGLLWWMGRTAEGAAALGRSVELDPVLAPARHAYAWGLSADGRYEEAIEQIRITTALDPSWTAPLLVRTWGYLRTGRMDEARASHRDWATRAEEDLDREVRAMEVLIQAELTGAPQSLDGYPKTLGRSIYFYAQARDREGVLEILDGFLDTNQYGAVARYHVLADRGLLRGDPRYAEILEAAGVTW